jgi:hypothetical protein
VWWGDQNIRRSIFMGDFVYAFSSAGVTATHLETLNETARVVLPQVDRYASYDDVAVSEDGQEDHSDDAGEEDRPASESTSSEDR